MRVVAISDTHNQAEGVVIPEGDVLVHAGDLTMMGKGSELERAARWLGSFKDRFKAVIAIPGNHDLKAQDDPVRTKALFAQYGVTLLIDEEYVVDGVKFYGSPWQSWFHDWAFNFPRDDDGAMAMETWAKIPQDITVLITHGPPYGILDGTLPGDERVGCRHLLRAILERPSIRAHIFGHIHEAFGTMVYGADDGTSIRFVNAAICDRQQYAPVQPPVEFTIEK